MMRLQLVSWECCDRLVNREFSAETHEPQFNQRA